MRISPNGNVGIGLVTPLAKLDVNGSTIIARNPSNASHGYMNIYNDGYMHMDAAGGAGNFAMNGWSAMGLSASASIGFSAPFIEVGNIPLIANSSSGILRFHSRDASNIDTYFDMYRTGGTGDFTMTTPTNSAIRMGTNNVNRFVISGNGNVGIGTTSPNTNLQVVGNAYINNSIQSSNFVSTISSLTDAFTYDNQNINHYGLKWTGDSWNSGGGTAWLSGYSGIKFFTNGAPKMVINHYGVVGIGDVSNATMSLDPNAKLFVNGNIVAKKLKVTQTGWADYVFDSAYSLMPLQEVAKFVTANKHLPDVPSAAAVEKNGIDIGDTQALLLRKIEELTLYVLQQQKAMDVQNVETNKLREQVKALESMIRK